MLSYYTTILILGSVIYPAIELANEVPVFVIAFFKGLLALFLCKYLTLSWKIAYTEPFSDICRNPKVDSRSYTTTDGMVITDVAFVSEFSVSCMANKDFVLFADKRGKQLPAVKSLDNRKYQISWTENAETLFGGEHGVKVYDEEGYAAVKKPSSWLPTWAHRNSEEVTDIPSAFFLSLYHRGTYYGPWLSTEFVASATSILLWYIAYSSKANLMS